MRKISDTSVEPSIGNFGNFGKFKFIRIRLRFIAIAAFRPPPQIDRRLPSPCAFASSHLRRRSAMRLRVAAPLCAAWIFTAAASAYASTLAVSSASLSAPHSASSAAAGVRVRLPRRRARIRRRRRALRLLRLASPSRLPARPRCAAWIFTAAASSSAFRAFISATDLRLTVRGAGHAS